jgi:putative DNA primase/helicase
MADFARFGVAIERVVGWPAGTFLATYGVNREAAHDLTLEASLVARPLRDFVPTIGAWTGPATDLLDALTQRVGEPVRRRREWPQTPTALSSQLRRLAPTLRTVGVDVLFHRSARHRRITLRVVLPGESASSASSV